MTGDTVTILHTSDFQCGSPFLPEAAEALARLAKTIQPDVIVSSGDLTQRAKRREFEQARSVLDRLGDRPVVLTPGNHDVPLYRFWERLASPYHNWRAFAGPDLNTVTRVGGATLVALNSSAPRRAIVNGHLGDEQVDFARRAFDDAPRDDFRLLVIHHHFIPVPDGLGGRPLPRAAQLARTFGEMGVDVVLGGHVHQLHVRTSALQAGDGAAQAGVRPLPFVACGTTLSRRGRGPEVGRNGLTVVRLSREEVHVTPYSRRVGGYDFEPVEAVSFPTRAAWCGAAGCPDSARDVDYGAAGSTA